MKKKLFSYALIAATAGTLFAFANIQTGVTGKVSPPEGAESVWAISGTDSLKGTLNAGNFSFTIKPGTYKIMVDAKDPYKDTFVENVEVKEGMPVDVGEIVLKK